MRIEADAVLKHPRSLVYRAYRDDLRTLVDYLPNVRSIDVVERREDGAKICLHNVWRGSAELPERLSKALETRFLTWDDRAVWDEATWSCEWTITPRAFDGAVRCQGRSEFVELPDERTRFEISGDLGIDMERVRALPKSIADAVGRTAEAFLVRQITANLAAVSDALAAVLGSDTVA